MLTDIKAAQADMRAGYLSGGAGILASSMAWLAAAVVAWRGTSDQAVLTLFAGGVLIHPVSLVICKLLRAPGGHTKGNPLASLAGATTFWLIFSLPLAYAAYLVRAQWFFPAMLLVIGGRYLTFATLYGMRIYWALGLVLASGAYLIAASKLAPPLAATAGGATELLFAVIVLSGHVRGRSEAGDRGAGAD